MPAALVLFLALAHPPDPRPARVDALFAHLNASPSPGAAIVVVRDGEVLLRRGYGLASLEHRVAVTPSTVFDTASLAKQFTGAAVHRLAAGGKLALSDPIGKHIPELGHLPPITIEQLLEHRSGLRDWVGALSVAGWRPDDPITFRQILTLAFQQRTLAFEPGSQTLYSNTGYNVLAELVQRVTGRRFGEWMAGEFFVPLGMTSTHVRDDYREVIADRAYGYARGPDGRFLAMPNNLIAPGSSSVFSTADDMARWLMNYRHAVPGSGITCSRYRGLPMCTSSGAWASFNAFDVYFPEQRFGVVVLANSNTNVIDAQQAVIAITDIYLEQELGPKTPLPADEPAAQQAQKQPEATGKPKLDDFTGEYTSEELGTSYRMAIRDGALELQHRRRGPIALTPVRGDEFTAPRDGYFASVRFERDGRGRVVGFVVNGDPRSPDLRFAR